ncbi:sulfotransferase family protein [Actinobacteria bacterium IMCC26256]|nr:sulfotransferase family protein [Actinobacteria bacterium IMCC26256]
MTPSAELVLLIGAPRSGTTWLQQMLGAHPLVAAPQETDLFSRFLQPLLDSWERETRGGQAGIEQRRFKGLHSVLTGSEFAVTGADLVSRVIANASALKPGSEVVVEKTPSHSLCASSIALFAPRAKIIHLVRDGRDVASSLVASGNGWGGWWAPKTVTRASEVWSEHIRGARASAGSDNYLEVRYEDMQTDGASTLERVFAHIGVAATSQDCEQLLVAFALDKMANGESSIVIGGDFAAAASKRSEPAGFFGKGGSGSWRAQWGRDELLAFNDTAGDLLVELGYEDSSDWAGSTSQIVSFRRKNLRSQHFYQRIERFSSAMDRLIRKQH